LAEKSQAPANVDELIDMLVGQPFRSESGDIGEFLGDDATPFNLRAYLTQFRPTVKSEAPFPEEDFTDRVSKRFIDAGVGNREMAAVHERTLDMGNEIVGSSILKQLNSLPSGTARDTREFNEEIRSDPNLADIVRLQEPEAFLGLDIFDFVARGNKDPDKEDLHQGRERSLLDKLTERDL